MSHTDTASYRESTRSRFSGTAPAPWSILLAGGNGSRLSRLIRWFHSDERPKQFATLIGRRSMLQHTWDRASAHSPADRAIVVLTGGQEGWARRQLPAEASGNFLIQPRNIGTGPAICLAIARVMAEDPWASVVIYPSDHFVWPEEKFQERVSHALDACNATDDPKIVILGAEPACAEEGMGWILPGKSLGQMEKPPLFLVDRFIEKPSSIWARWLLEEGALWNTFIMAGRARTFWSLVWEKRPEAMGRLELFRRHCREEAGPGQTMNIFEGLEAFDFSHDVLQQAQDHLILHPLHGVRWRDWGTPEGFFETIEAMGWTDKVDQKILSSEFERPRLGEYWIG